MNRKRALGALLLVSVLILAFNIQQAGSLLPPLTEWTKTYGTIDDHEEARCLIQTDDGGYAMLGLTQHWYAGHVYSEDFWFVKTDASGNVQWNQTYAKGSLSEIGVSIVQTDDYGYAMAGFSNYYITPDFAVVDAWLVKVCVGDVNDDGVINVVDLTIVSFAYGCFEGDPDYNPDADLNCDGLADMKDMVIVARNLCKPP